MTASSGYLWGYIQPHLFAAICWEIRPTQSCLHEAKPYLGNHFHPTWAASPFVLHLPQTHAQNTMVCFLWRLASTPDSQINNCDMLDPASALARHGFTWMKKKKEYILVLLADSFLFYMLWAQERGRNGRCKLLDINLRMLHCFPREGCHIDGYEKLQDTKDLGPVPGSCGIQLCQPSTMHNIYVI